MISPLLRKNQKTLPKPTNRDRIVWALAVKAYGDTEIAQRLQMSDDEVMLAKLRMQAHIASVSHDVVDMVVNEEILAVARGGGISRALNGALGAQRVLVSSQGVVLDPVTGVPMTEHDHATQLEAVRTVSTLTKNLRPTGPSVVANIQNNNSNTQNNLIGGGRSFEARRRAAAERRGAVAVADAEEVDEDDAEEILEGDTELDDPDDVDDDPEDDEDE
jgi:hypothetical protein